MVIYAYKEQLRNGVSYAVGAEAWASNNGKATEEEFFPCGKFWDAIFGTSQWRFFVVEAGSTVRELRR
jgi:hypothetical protein